MKKYKIIMLVGVILLLLLSTRFIYSIPRGEVVNEKKDELPTITILAGQSTADAGTEEMIQKVLEEKFPDVNFEWICVGWSGNNFLLRLTGKYETGKPPDIIIGKAQDVVSYASSGVFLPLSEQIVSRIRDEEKQTVTYQGKVYGLPYTCQYQGVLYNKDIFLKYGMEPPTTREELENIVLIFEQNQIVPFASHYQEAWKVGNSTMQFWMNDIFQYDSMWGNKLREGKVTFRTSPVAKEAFLNGKYILEHSWNDALQINQYECDERFGKGQAAMYLTGFWSLQSIGQVTTDTNMGIFPFPNRNGDAKLIKETNITFMKGASTQYGELVDKILKEIGSNEELAGEIADFTKSESTFQTIKNNRIIEVQDDIDRYEKEENIIDVTIGNTQLIWDYQSDLAEEELLWLQGKESLAEVINYADSTIKNSIAEE